MGRGVPEVHGGGGNGRGVSAIKEVLMSSSSGLVLAVAVMGSAFILMLLAFLLVSRRLSIARKAQAATASALKDCSDTEAGRRSELRVAREMQEAFFPIPPDGYGLRPSIGTLNGEMVEICGYHQAAGALTGDFFDWERVSNDHYLMIHGDIAGHGIPPAFIAVQVATIFREWCRRWQPDAPIEQLLYHINDMLIERRFPNRFAAVLLGHINVRTGDAEIIQAAFESLLWFKAKEKKPVNLALPQCAAAGVFPSDMLRERSAYKPVSLNLEIGDVLIFLSDGLEESYNAQHDGSRPLGRNGESRGVAPEQKDRECLRMDRIRGILEAVMNRRTYILQGDPDAQPAGKLSFDFSGCTGTATEAVLALVSVEKVFRLAPQRSAGDGRRVEVEDRVHRFLIEHFEQYSVYFSGRADGDGGNVSFFDHLQEAPQYDDISIVAVRRTEAARSSDKNVPEELAVREVSENLEELPVIDDDEEGPPLPAGESVN